MISECLTPLESIQEHPVTAFSTSKSYLIVGMLVQVILLILVLTEYPFFSYFFKDENAVHKNRIILVKT